MNIKLYSYEREEESFENVQFLPDIGDSVYLERSIRTVERRWFDYKENLVIIWCSSN